MNKNLISLLCVLFPIAIFAQKAPIKFGKIEEEIVKATTHPLDTGADAVILADYGTTIFRYLESSGFIFELKRTLRIKILTKDGLDYGDYETAYYRTSGANENVSSIKGYTYNYVNGKVVRSKLEKSSIFREAVDDHWNKVKISMPDVEAGSVIELSYTLTSPFTWNLQTWYFQSDIPTVHSEYIVSIPEYFDYQQIHSGYHPLAVNEKKSSAGTIIFAQAGRSSSSTSSQPPQKIDYNNNIYRWVMKNVPAFKPEPYIANPSDYISKVEFELKGTQYPNQAYKQHMGSWASLNRSFLESSYFGLAIQQTGYMKDELKVISALESDNEKIAALVNLVRGQIEWNGNYGIYSTAALRRSWNDKKGNTADINLTIVAGLKELGFEADPVLISTRGHGKIREMYAVSNQFNSVIAYVGLGDNYLLLDGTDRFLPVGVLPKKCLNGKGWKVSKTAARWINVSPSVKEEWIEQGDLTINPAGTLEGTIELMAKGYAGYSQHKKLRFDGSDEFFEDFQAKKEHWLIEEYEYDEEAKFTEPFKCKYTIELEDEIVVAGDRIYFNPTLNEVMDENPFKLEKREYPVDFTYPLRNAYMIKYTIPEGYEVEELPKPVAYMLPNNAGKFVYNISNMGNSLMLTVDFKINKSLFAQTEYPVLKQFYHQVEQKCEEQVVLKKSN